MKTKFHKLELVSQSPTRGDAIALVEQWRENNPEIVETFALIGTTGPTIKDLVDQGLLVNFTIPEWVTDTPVSANWDGSRYVKDLRSFRVSGYYIGATKVWVGMAHDGEHAKARADLEIKTHWPEIGRMTAATVKVINHDETA